MPDMTGSRLSYATPPSQSTPIEPPEAAVFCSSEIAVSVIEDTAFGDGRIGRT